MWVTRIWQWLCPQTRGYSFNFCDVSRGTWELAKTWTSNTGMTATLSAYIFALQNGIGGRGFPCLKLKLEYWLLGGIFPFWSQTEGSGFSQSARRKMQIFSSLILFWKPTSLEILCRLKVLAVFWRSWDGTLWLTQATLMYAVAGLGRLHKSYAHSCPLSSVGSWACVAVQAGSLVPSPAES